MTEVSHFRITARELRDHKAVARNGVDLAVREALEASMRTLEARYGLLPTPVRLRACGAVAAWEAARAAAGPAGRQLEALIRDPAVAPLSLLEHQASFIDAHTSFDFVSDPMGRIMRKHAVNTVYRQAFWARNGALYEPTPALHRLLEETDVGQDVPLAMVSLPASAVCIVPVPEVRDAQNGFQAMLVFEHAPPPGAGDVQRGLTFILQTFAGDDAMTFGVGGDSRLSLAEAFRQPLEMVSLRPRPEVLDVETAYARWKGPLDYTMKLLLYLTLGVSQVMHERPYSLSPKAFPGLGKRKREERMAQVEMLYDRYIVGPTVLADTQDAPRSAGGGGEVSAHWRRGHFRMQPHGPQASLRKLLFIAPTLVRGDRLA